MGDYNDKGVDFPEFLKCAAKCPKKIIFFDDKRKNVVSPEKALEGSDSEYVGYHDSAIEHPDAHYCRELADQQCLAAHPDHFKKKPKKRNLLCRAVAFRL